MMRTFFVFILLFISVWLGVQLQRYPSYLIIYINNWSIETTLTVAIIALIILFFTLHILLLGMRWFTHIPYAWHEYRAKRQMQKELKRARKALQSVENNKNSAVH